jgi:hypothetical protein
MQLVWLHDCIQPPAHVGSLLADFSTLKMEAIRSSETSVNARSTQGHIPEDDILQYWYNLHTFSDWFSSTVHLQTLLDSLITCSAQSCRQTTQIKHTVLFYLYWLLARLLVSACPALLLVFVLQASSFQPKKYFARMMFKSHAKKCNNEAENRAFKKTVGQWSFIHWK